MIDLGALLLVIATLLLAFVTSLLVIATLVAGLVVRWLDRRQKRKSVIRAMRSALVIVQHANALNEEPATESQHVIPIEYPIAPYDSLLTENGVSVREKTLTAVAAYIAKAHQLNATVRVLQLATIESQQIEPTITIKRFLKNQAAEDMKALIAELKTALTCEC